MKNRDRYFIGACVGMPFGLVGMGIGTFLAWIFNRIRK